MKNKNLKTTDNHFPEVSFTTKEASEYLSLSEQKLRQDRMRRTTGSIPFVRLGRSVRYLKLDLDSYIAKHRIAY